jgi:hypothetical protein
MRRNTVLALAAVLAVGAPLALADTFTVATFADPAPNASAPLFSLTGNTLSGGWSGTGLSLDVPVAGVVYHDATFAFSDLTVLDGDGTLSGGTIEFFDSLSNSVLTIDFVGAQMLSFSEPPITVIFGFAAADSANHDVSFAGPGVPGGLTEELFAFSFANPRTVGETTTWTASFTSSAIPEPASLVLLALGAAVLRRR